MTTDELKQIGEIAWEGDAYPNPMFPASPYYRFLKELAKYKKPKLSVELGVSGGGGSLHLALGWSEGRVIGVDFADDHKERIAYIVENYPNFTFALGDSTKSAKTIHALYGKIDILFIDTDHTYDRTLSEFRAWKPFLAKGACVCFDDLFRPGMEQAWNKIPGDKVRLDYLHNGEYPVGGGFGVAIVK